MAATATSYERRLLAAADLVLSADAQDKGIRLPDLGVTADLKPHQLHGVAWLIRRYRLGVNVVLVVLCPLSVTDGWLSEFSKFCPSFRVMQYVGGKLHRRDLRRTIYEDVQKASTSSRSFELPFDVLMTTYDIALMDQDFLSQIPWHYAVIDEAQRLKNPSSVSRHLIFVLYNVLEQRFIMPRRLLLTGTPIQNNLSELWALMHFCLPSIFGKLDEFLSTFKEAGESLTGDEANKAKGQFKIIKHVLKAFMLRRTKFLLIESGILALPPLTELTVMVPLTQLQKKLYMSVLRKELPTLISFARGSSRHQSLQNIVIQLRKVCSHPYLFSGIEPEPYVEGEHLIQASGKLIVLDLILKKLHECGHRVLLFAQMTQTLDILQDFLELRNYTYERLDGSVRAEERFAAIRNFSSQSTKGLIRDDNRSEAFVFMISTRAGGVGLNLIGADTVIFYEQDWNPQADKQALQRAHRIGQLNHVLSINLVSQRTIEEVIMRRADRKLKLSHNIIGEEDGTDGKGGDPGIEASDMRSIIFGLHLFDPADTATETIDEDITAETFSVEKLAKLKTMSEKVVMMRSHESSEKDERAFEINPNMTDDSGTVIRRASDSIRIDPGLNEAAYLSWVKKFKEASISSEDATVGFGRQRAAPEEKLLKHDVNKQKIEEKRLAKWESLGYQTLAVKEPDITASQNISDAGSIQFVYGDCTNPSKVCPAKPAIIFSCIDNSGTWGHGGMFDALTSLSTCIPDAYHRASEFDDLHMGDLHLIQLDEGNCTRSLDAPLWVALAIVQSYNPRRKVPRSEISMSDLELCISKAAFSAAQHSAAIHMPRIGYQGGSQRSEWYTIERLLRKHSSLHGIDIFVYYFQRRQTDCQIVTQVGHADDSTQA
ncbi:probable helicase CHR10 isoform X5 [Zea mays]|uniref:probable helicase CHR10 isoform X5 n=1 Tax=Zea mays TaxID=4577 RepID=UPI0009AA7A22|nr:probable helicase CHR10 isoform X5 [Zea mays]|eukprot:XP_020399594.1 probable helicase CHR10 isoform X3 [Zea mays]